jgi:sugar lactone lactonase YvrE
MLSRKLLLYSTLVVLSLTCLTSTSAQSSPGQVMHEWVQVDFDWPSQEFRQRCEDAGEYVPDHNLISGIKTYKGDIYLTVPRLRYTLGVPSTLNKLVTRGNQTVLSPFPDWEAQQRGNCSALQCAMSMEVDPITGYMYVIDPGRTGIVGKRENQSAPVFCPPKLVVYDLNTGSLLRSHNFPPEVASNQTNFLNDIVLDRGSPSSSTARWVYITDAADSKLIVFDLQTNESRAIHHASMEADPGVGSNISVNGVTYKFIIPIDGLAVSSDFQFVYYCALGSKDLYQVPTTVLRDKSQDFGVQVRLVGPKISQTGGMVYATDNLYYGALTKSGVYRWRVAYDEKLQGVTAANVAITTETSIVEDATKLEWPDSFTVDEDGYLWFTACRAQRFLLSQLDFTGGQGPNYRIWRINIAEKSYLAPRGSSSFLHAGKGSVLLGFVSALLLYWR